MYGKILIIQTAFLGDVILTLPLVQVLNQKFPKSKIDFLCIPQTSGLLKNNPFINETIVYDKRNSGNRSLDELIKTLKSNEYDVIISPHRSFRSSMISYFSKARNTISFNTSSFSFLYRHRVSYFGSSHEIQRNLKLLEPLGIIEDSIIQPELFPGTEEETKVNEFFLENKIDQKEKIIAVAPGSVWFTKRFPEEKFVKLCDLLSENEFRIILIGGKDDEKYCSFIKKKSINRNIINAAGNFSILESAEIIKRSALLVSNDSAPLHIADAVGTPVIAVFGATIPQFGFYPYGKKDVIIETNGLKCRPCSIHGGNKCPIGTFVCMKNIEEERIAVSIKKILSEKIV
ncbi:MAG: glycosyltransferase family 9 protein [bacterium]|nr:glycosyltransferase family 9 protein [bacterium]